MPELTPAVADFLVELHRRDEQTRERIAMFHDGRLGLFGQNNTGVWVDETYMAIALDERVLANNAKIYAQWDSDGLMDIARAA